MVGNNKKYKGILTSQLLLATTIVGVVSGGGMELEKKKEKRNKFRAPRERWCGGLTLSLNLFFVNKLNIPNHNDPNWH